MDQVGALEDCFCYACCNGQIISVVIMECQPDTFYSDDEDLDEVIDEEIVFAKESVSNFFVSECGVG